MNGLEEPDVVVVEFDSAVFVAEDDPRAGWIVLGKREAVSSHRTYVRIDVKKDQGSRCWDEGKRCSPRELRPPPVG